MECIIPITLLLSILGTAPVAVCLFLTSFVAIFFFSDVPIGILGEAIFYKINSYSLLAVPFFILAGNIMVQGSTAKRIIGVTNALVKFCPGGLAIAGVLACGVFAAISGSSPATVIAIGSFLIPAMIEKNYGRKFSVGLIASSGSLGILIPPSIPMIIYGLLVGVSVGRLFLAGILPGLIIILTFSIYSAIKSMKNSEIVREPFRWGEVYSALKGGYAALGLPLIILGGIYAGIFTPTEAGAIAAFLALFVELYIYRTVSLKNLPNILIDSTITTATLVIIVSSASAFGEYLTIELIPDQIANFLLETIHNKSLFLLVVNVVLLFVGTFMDIISAMLILVPILSAALPAYGIDPIHFAIIFIFNMEIGYLTPPLGINIYVASSISRMAFTDVIKATLPTLFLMIICLALFTIFPQISTCIPNLIMGE